MIVELGFDRISLHPSISFYSLLLLELRRWISNFAQVLELLGVLCGLLLRLTALVALSISQHFSPALRYGNYISAAVPAAASEASTHLRLHLPSFFRPQTTVTQVVVWSCDV